MIKIDHIQVRYRRLSPAGSWTYIDIPQSQGSIQVNGFQRGQNYQFEARSVAASGAVSAWVQQNHTVAGTSLGPLMPITLAAYPSADGVLLTWTLVGQQRADVYYQVQRSTVSPAYVWETIASPSDTYFTEITRETIQKWYRVRSLDYAGLASSYSAIATATYSTTAPTNEPQPDRPPSQSGPQPL